MGIPLRVLIVDDSEDDAILLVRELRCSGYELTFERVDTPAAMKAALDKQPWDIVIADYIMPQFDGLAALALLQESGLDLPFILVSGTIGEETAVKAMRAGAQDYIMKDNLPRLAPAIDRELRELRVRRERKRMEGQFLRAQRMESIGALASGIAHDLNNVLSPILMAVEVLRQNPPKEQAQWVLATVESNAKRGQELVKQVLAFGRGVEGEHVVLQPRHLIREMENLLREVFPKRIEIRTNIAQDLWTVSGDATQLHQVLMNLCVNARDAMPDGGTLSISAENFFIDENHRRIHADARVGPYLILTISDTGTGISREILGKVFEPFFTTKEIGKGTGLGLSTALSITKGHGGFMDVYSHVGRGTAFKVYLPATEAAEVQQKPNETPDLPAGNGELILVVDDEASIREITRATLEAYGYRVIMANNGAEAIALYLQNKEEIQLVLMDTMMPVMEGLTSVRMLRKINPQIKILAVSGLPSDEILSESSDTGVQAFLQKPYSGERLLHTLHKILHAPRVN
ncbi:MAG: response regulator [Candidatus Tectomicrobia bacterium]|uniref:histidine kinase n=1 Tax=Tectimicrobiota bacterium TaxID=2528274 RepID=A0A932FXH8_UNCTE|nr:response regulator [Candidatus Tectomicrobia bacterium]